MMHAVAEKLALGNTLFVALWMAMYELEVLKDRQSFGELVTFVRSPSS